MRRESTKYTVTYSDEIQPPASLTESWGFKRIETPDTVTLTRTVEMNPMADGASFGLLFELFDTIHRKDLSGQSRKMIHSFPVTDANLPLLHTDMAILHSGDVRGHAETMLATRLFIECYVLNPKSGCDKYLPEVLDHYRKTIPSS